MTEFEFYLTRGIFVGPVFEPLRDVQYFMNFKISFNTLEWENGADFAPEYLYEISKPVSKAR